MFANLAVGVPRIGHKGPKHDGRPYEEGVELHLLYSSLPSSLTANRCITKPTIHQKPQAVDTIRKLAEARLIAPIDRPIAGVITEATTLEEAMEFKKLARSLVCSTSAGLTMACPGVRRSRGGW